jgi:hypothetical protein
MVYAVISWPSLDCPLEGCRGLMVMASGWQSFDRQYEPYLRAFMAAPLRCGLGCRSRTDGRIHRSWIFCPLDLMRPFVTGATYCSPCAEDSLFNFEGPSIVFYSCVYV